MKAHPFHFFCLYFSFIGDAVVNVYINHEKKFAFVEMRSVEEASNAMALDGIILEVIRYFFYNLGVQSLLVTTCIVSIDITDLIIYREFL